MYFIHYFMSPLLMLRRNVLAPSWRRRVGRAELSIPSFPFQVFVSLLLKMN